MRGARPVTSDRNLYICAHVVYDREINCLREQSAH